MSGGSFRNESSNHMAFPHPKSRQDHYRNEHIPGSRRVIWNLVKRAIDVADDRSGKDDVNPAKNETLKAWRHRSPRFLGGQFGVLMPNCWAYSAFSRCQPANFVASPPAMRLIGVPLRRWSRTSKAMCHPAAPIEMK